MGTAYVWNSLFGGNAGNILLWTPNGTPGAAVGDSVSFPAGRGSCTWDYDPANDLTGFVLSGFTNTVQATVNQTVSWGPVQVSSGTLNTNGKNIIYDSWLQDGGVVVRGSSHIEARGDYTRNAGTLDRAGDNTLQVTADAIFSGAGLNLPSVHSTDGEFGHLIIDAANVATFAVFSNWCHKSLDRQGTIKINAGVTQCVFEVDNPNGYIEGAGGKWTGGGWAILCSPGDINFPASINNDIARMGWENVNNAVQVVKFTGDFKSTGIGNGDTTLGPVYIARGNGADTNTPTLDFNGFNVEVPNGTFSVGSTDGLFPGKCLMGSGTHVFKNVEPGPKSTGSFIDVQSSVISWTGIFGLSTAWDFRITAGAVMSGATFRAPTGTGSWTCEAADATLDATTFVSNGGTLVMDRNGNQTFRILSGTAFSTIHSEIAGIKIFICNASAVTLVESDGTSIVLESCATNLAVLPGSVFDSINADFVEYQFENIGAQTGDYAVEGSPDNALWELLVGVLPLVSGAKAFVRLPRDKTTHRYYRASVGQDGGGTTASFTVQIHAKSRSHSRGTGVVSTYHGADGIALRSETDGALVVATVETAAFVPPV